MPPVAPPPTVPPKPMVVLSWQMVKSLPASTVGVAITVTVRFILTAGQGAIPVVVSVSVALPLYPAGGVQVAFRVFAFGLNVPPAELVQSPPVADPPMTPPSAVLVPP